MRDFKFYEELKEYISHGTFKPNCDKKMQSEVRRVSENFINKDNQLFYVGPSGTYMRLVILSEEEKRGVLSKCHNNPETGKHRGVRGTRDKAIAGYFWSTLIKDVTEWVQCCQRCQTNGSPKMEHQDGTPVLNSNKQVSPSPKKCKRKTQNDPTAAQTGKKRVKRNPQKLKTGQNEKQQTSTETESKLSNEPGQVGGNSLQSLHSLLSELTKVDNSRQRAKQLFQWIIHPVSSDVFFSNHWEKKPLLIRRPNSNYYKGLFSTSEFDRILKNEDVQFGVNLDVTSYRNDKRQTHNPPGRALPHTVWNFYESGCSLRMLNPQAFSSVVWNVLSMLQEQFNSMAGANVYLTPAGTQGFAPHYDDIEAFIVQLEGNKRWKVYKPRFEDETLSLISSANLSQAEIGNPVLDAVLGTGDLLYLPRGFIHQGNCLPDAHSLHITISSFQRNSWGDLLLKAVPAALEMAIEEDVEFRKGLPLDYLTYMGVQNSEKDDPRRAQFLAHMQDLMMKLYLHAPVDAAVDQKAREFLHDCLPPALTPAEKASSVYGAPARFEDGKAVDVTVRFTTQTKIRLLRAGITRLCSDGDAVRLYYITENSRVYHKEELRSLEIKAEHTDAVEFLINKYPKFVPVSSLPCDSAEDKIFVTELLFGKGLIHTSEPLTS